MNYIHTFRNFKSFNKLTTTGIQHNARKKNCLEDTKFFHIWKLFFLSLIGDVNISTNHVGKFLKLKNCQGKH